LRISSVPPGVFGAVWAQAELRKVLKAVGATVIPCELPVATASRVFSGEGRIEDRTVAAALAAIVGELVAGISERAA
jgi:chromate reductase, NAD(P)H dehydrogenase (quinone)